MKLISIMMMKLVKWLVLGFFCLVVLIASIYGLYKAFSIWTFEKEIMRNDKPYGGGDLRVKNRDLLVFKPIEPLTKIKEVKDWKDPNVAEFAEPWMYDVKEVSNRSSVRLLRGAIENDVKRIFEQRGQNGGWWVSPDWKTIYVTTEWMNYKLPNGPDGYGQAWHTLWRSQDGGDNWQQLKWPELINAGQPLFLADGKRGYLIAWDMRVWRTQDSGDHWEELKLPAWANQQLHPNPDGNGFSPWVKDTRARFDAFDLASNGTLRLSFFVKKAQLGKQLINNSSLVYALPWGISENDLFNKWINPETILPMEVVRDIKSDKQEGQHLITLQGMPIDWQKTGDVQRIRLANYVYLNKGKEVLRHVFPEYVKPGALFIGNKNELVLAADKKKKGQIMSDSMTMVSKDMGKSWDEFVDGSAYAWYYEAEVNRIWKYETYSLYRRDL
ncbi:WD40/YVTN/BNR-like repeat-containing protein [Janthinobacterium sp. B9-8]|uniref:WD40/YVTN/BNR-like repeat-containing protein n=1 Tax=Janthinobacterium sp. B9-8 TaxID=1236179 RepID=UPI00069C7D45|nr:hypothetical protein [Janthinobacterium sp. B9-8]AMC34104.1 hypothetical protein VN23_05590 [Janthinobacterium sp. B9-8]